MWSKTLDNISFWSLFLTVVLLPVFFIPFTKIPIETAKGLLFVLGLGIAILAWLGARFSDGKIYIPKSNLFLSGGIVLLVTLFSAIFSKPFSLSFFGTLFEVSSFLFIFATFLLMFFSSLIFNDVKKIRKLLKGVTISFALVLVFQVFRIMAPSFFSLGIFTSKVDNLFGSWNSLGILAGLLVVMSLYFLEFFNFNGKKKMAMAALLFFAVLFLIAVNYYLIWLVVLLFTIFIFIYKIAFSVSKNENGEKSIDFPAFTFGIIMISLLFYMSGQFIGGYIPDNLGLNNFEISPSFSTTMSIGWESLKQDPIFGIGPNKFSLIWSLYKEQAINTSIVWNSVFSFGSGVFPTLLINTGLFGILAWLIFFGFIVLHGIKIFFSNKNFENKLEIMGLFMFAFFLFVFSFVYSVGTALFLFVFIFLGACIGIMMKKDDQILIHVFAHPKKSFFVIFALILAMVATAGSIFKFGEKFASVYYFTNALNNTEIEKVELNLNKALSLYRNDLYLRTHAQVYLTKLNLIFNKTNSPGVSLTEEDRNNIQTNFSQALLSAESAVAYNNKNYLNYISLGTVYQSVVPFRVEGAYQSAIDTYIKAGALNPLNPQIKLKMAESAVADANFLEAKNYALESYNLKNNYVDSLILLSQLANREGNKEEALNYARLASSILPDNKDLSNYVSSFNNVIPSIEEAIVDTEEKKESTKKQ